MNKVTSQIRVKLTAEDRPIVSNEKKVTVLELVINIIDLDDNQPYFNEVGSPQLIVFASIEEEQVGLVELDIHDKILDLDTAQNRDNDLFYISDNVLDSDTSFDLVGSYNAGQLYLNVSKPLDYEIITDVKITIGCKRASSLPVLPYNERQVATIILQVININDNPPGIAGLDGNGTLSSSVYLSSSPDSQSILSISADDIDFGQQEFFYNITEESVVARRKQRSASKYITIESSGNVRLLSSIPSEIFFIELGVEVSGCSDINCSAPSGPVTLFKLKIYPIREEDVVKGTNSA